VGRRNCYDVGPGVKSTVGLHACVFDITTNVNCVVERHAPWKSSLCSSENFLSATLSKT